MDPGLSNPEVVGDPVTKQDIREEMGAEVRPFILTKASVREAAEKIGYTDNCRGCKGVRLNYSSRPIHSEECRKRMEAEINKTARRGSSYGRVRKETC